MSKTWVVVPTCLPIVLRRCHMCASGRFRANGGFRVNASDKPLAAWLPALCAGCGDTTKLTVLERMNVRSVQPERPAWQSPYGPPPHRAHRGRWAPAPVPARSRSRSAVRRGHLCDRCD